jgi:alpha-ketoglutarate-dependent taurine dioxygenase
MDIVPVGPGFAAELRGVTLADVAADAAAYRQTRAAFEEHSVLVFRGQDVSDETQLAFSRRFGPLEVTKVGSQGVGTNLVILSTIDENGKVVPGDHRLALRNKANQLSLVLLIQYRTIRPDRYFYTFAALLGCRDRRTVCLGRAPANCNNTAGAAIRK